MANIRNVTFKVAWKVTWLGRVAQTFALLCAAMAHQASCFELETHSSITKAAFDQSVLGNPSLFPQRLLDNLGINRGVVYQTPHRRDCDNANEAMEQQFAYFDGPRRRNPHCRWVTKWDRTYGGDVKEGSVSEWIQVGVIREDDFRVGLISDAFKFGVWPEENWQDPGPPIIPILLAIIASPLLFDDWPVIWQITFTQICGGTIGGMKNNIRMLSHFFDPATNRPLSPPICALFGVARPGYKAPAWAFGWEDLDKPGRPSSSFENHFTLFDMHESFYRAITGHTIDLAGNLIPVAMGSQRERNDWWATGFRSLGDVLHLLQDMGQPQHTRNDQHAGIPVPILKDLLGHASLFEKYVEERATGKSSIDIDKECADQSYGSLRYDVGYPIPSFPGYLDYWTTSLGSQFNDGKGLADYTNRGFFTEGTNLDASQNVYSKPSKDLTSYREFLQPTRPDCPPGGTSAVLFGEVGDDNAPGFTSTNVPLTTCSFLSISCASSSSRTYTVNRRVLNSMADLVVPRAVAYSTGLINHVFRGRLEIKPPSEGVYSIANHSTATGFDKLSVTLTNATADIGAMDGSVARQNMVLGHLVAVARFHRNSCYRPTLTGEYGQNFSVETDLVRCRAGRDERSDLAQEIIVSKPINNFSLIHGQGRGVTFDFSVTPIPFDAIFR
jgi:hypothetical protein